MFDERALLDAAQQGNLDAFNQLVLHYQSMAYSVTFRIVQNQDDAIDIVQASFLTAFHKLAQLQGNNFKSWLMRIVVNRSYDLLRSRKRRTMVSWEDTFEQSEESASELTDEGETPLAYAERSELNDAINQGLRALREEYRTVLVLADVEGYSYEEIAEMMNWPLGTVKSSLSRGRAQLRDYLLRRSDLLPSNLSGTSRSRDGDRSYLHPLPEKRRSSFQVSKNKWNTNQEVTVVNVASYEALASW
ncbi:MAG: sigma-70 family RNA polymerase sigma factor [Caldilineaceae bacterium]